MGHLHIHLRGSIEDQIIISTFLFTLKNCDQHFSIISKRLLMNLMVRYSSNYGTIIRLDCLSKAQSSSLSLHISGLFS
jgi:hypothetical protein